MNGGGHHMTYVRKKGRRFWLPAGLSILATALAATMWVTVAAGRSSTSTASTIKIAILSDCQGAFASNYEQDIGGAITALAQYAGVKPKNPNKPSAGWTGGKIGGHPLKLVGIGCSNDKADTAIKETRRLMEQLGADLMIGPLSGDESVAVANYAKQHRNKTFVNGTAGAWDTTAAVKAPNFFRFNGDGIQWNAGIGDLAYKKLHWRKAAIIMDDYSFGYASGAGMIADFCAAGADKQLGPRLNGAYVGGFGSSPDLKGAAVTKYKKILDRWFKKYPPLAGKASDHAADGFTYNYYNNAWALVKALKAVKGDLSGGQKKLQAALRKTIVNGAYGKITLDKNRQAIQPQYSYRMNVKASGGIAISTVQYMPGVRQSFGGSITKPPSRNSPACVHKKLPWTGKERPVVNGVIK